jgi:hypothetical protein
MSLKDLPRWALPAAFGAIIIVVLVAVLVSGGGDDGTTEGPAAVVPASAPVYVDLSLRPEGGAKESAEAALGKVLDTDDPGGKLVSLIEEQAKAAGDDFDYSDDVEPWLGEHFAVYLTKIGGNSSDSEGGFIFETKDPEKALDFVTSQEDDAGDEQEYHGVRYRIDNDGDAFGLIGDFIVGADPPAFKAAVDAHNGQSLAESSDFKDAVGDLSSDRLATLYVPVDGFLNAIDDTELDPQSRSLVEKGLGDFADEPILGQVTASATDVTLELSAGGTAETEESSLLDDLPADTWLALGVGDVGGAIDSAVASLDDAGIDADTINAQVQSQTGIELDALTAALGEAALFVNGTTQADLGGALVIQDKDETVTANLLARLQRLITQQSQGAVKVQPLAGAGGAAGFQIIDPTGRLKKPIQVVQADGKIVAGYGASSVQQAANIATSAKTLSDEASFGNARAAVGDLGVDAFLAIDPILALSRAGAAAADPNYQLAAPYLEHIDFVASGSGSDEGRTAVRFVLGLR